MIGWFYLASHRFLKKYSMSFNEVSTPPFSGLPELPGARRRLYADAWQGWMLCLSVVMCAAGWSFQLLTFTHAKEGLLVFGVFLASLGLIARGAMSARGWKALLPLWLGVLVVVWTGLFVVGVRRPEAVLEEAVRIMVMLTAGLMAYDLLEQQLWRRRFRGAMVLSGLVVVVLGLAQFAGVVRQWFPVSGPNDQVLYSVFGNQDFYGGYAAITLALAVAPALGRGRRGWWWVLAAMVLLSGVAISSSRSAWLAAGAGVLMAVWVARSRLAWGRVLVFGLLAMALIGAAMVLYPERTVERIVNTMRPGDAGGHLRLWFWSGAFLMIRDHAAFGIGLGNFGYWSPLYQGLALAEPGGQLLAHNSIHTLHAHSEPLEIAAETGLLGLSFIGWMVLRLIKRRGPEWAGLAALLVFVLFNSSLHSPPFGLVAVLLTVMLLARENRIPLTSKDSRVLPWAMVALSLALAVAVVWIVLLPSYLLTRAEATHVAGNDPVAQYGAVAGHAWPSPEAHEELAIALYEQSDFAGAREQLFLAQEGVDTGRLYLLLARVSMRLGDDRLARDAMQKVLNRWPWHAEAWNVLYAAATDEERTALEDHARRWGISLPRSEPEGEQPVGEDSHDPNTGESTFRTSEL